MNPTTSTRIRVIDSHTGGEPTRVVLDGVPLPTGGTLAEQVARLRESFDGFRAAIACEPRGSDTMVGAYLVEPVDRSCAAGVIFFNNVGYLGMCGHGTIGLAATLRHLGRIGAGRHRIETPVGVVGIHCHADGRVGVDNVPSYRLAKAVAVDVEGHGRVHGDVAWGGNWFFLVEDHGQNLALSRARELTEYTRRIRDGLQRAGVTGAGGAEIDHIELFAPTSNPDADSRNFVLCPGLAYDRSPCGTGTSAKLACLAADGKLAPGEVWRQESIVGSVFEASYRLEHGDVLPQIAGRAWIIGEATLLLDPTDPFRHGIV